MIRPDTIIGRRLAERALEMVSGDAISSAPGDGLIDLTRREDAPTPAHIGDAAKDALDRGETHYTSRPGVPELRSAIAAYSTAEGFPATTDDIVITNGGAEALYIALQSTLKPGDRAAIIGPIAPNVAEMIDFIGAQRVALATAERIRSVPDVTAIARTDAAVLLLGSPSPITGVAIPPEMLRTIVAAAIERGMAVILDRSLAWCAFDPDLGRFPDADLGAKIMTTNSFSLAWGMDGWRVGYFTAPAGHIAAMRELKQAMSICTSSVSQFAALAALEDIGPWLASRRSEYTRRLDAATRILTDAGVGVIRPDAWPFLLLDTRLIHPDDRQAAAMIAHDAGLLVEPASIYGDALAGHVRIRLDAPEQALLSGLERLIAFHNTCL